ncbi:DUF4085 family protein [Desulfosporosinus sp. OT]|uniref:DUF4085 family protein n=1 Tax=Desulfosporosinus sp. OT TaxID=913865 RepID=UPI0002239FB9|nr:DUF4085 family protein [Desulfosporosinus sp. OT]EGW40049.1 hypothetical protein DOT_2049 [Desulfosporosinus sp. OT]
MQLIRPVAKHNTVVLTRVNRSQKPENLLYRQKENPLSTDALVQAYSFLLTNMSILIWLNHLEQIADVRVFSLGYRTRDILQQLINLSEENRKTVQRVSNEYSKARQAEDIPQTIRERFAFHDCLVTAFSVDQDVVMHLDTRGGFTNYNRITFAAAEMIKRKSLLLGAPGFIRSCIARKTVMKPICFLPGMECLSWLSAVRISLSRKHL